MKKILIVEDNISTKQIYRDFLDRFENIALYEASDGIEGFEKAKEITPHLIVLDNRMPGLSGEQTAKKLKAHPRTSKIPLIMVTSMQMHPSQVELIKLDVNEFIQHPLNLWDFQKTAEKYIGPFSEITLDP